MNWHLHTGSQTMESGVDATASTGITLTGGAANTKGSYAQLIASTGQDASGFLLILMGNSAVGSFLVDVAVGAASSEVVIVPNLLVAGGAANLLQAMAYFPVAIPADTRISARCQDSVGATTIDVGVILLAGTFRHDDRLSRVTAYGATTTDSGGIQVDPGAVAHTKGAWSELSAATTNDIHAAVIAVTGQANAAPAAYSWLVDIGVGAAASEVVVVPDLLVQTTAATSIHSALTGAFPCGIPGGVRLAARAQCSGNDATDRLIDVAVFGVD